MNIGINDLPVYVWPSIFRYLSIQDLFNCRLVNKKFKDFSDHSDHIDKLVIGEPFKYKNEYHGDYYWVYCNKSIEDKEIISLKCFRSIKSLSIFNLDKYLKYLKICCVEFELEEISNLINLECIEFNTKYGHHNQQIINLNNLKNLAFHLNKFYNETNFSFELNTPKLEKIQLYDINFIQFNSSPESIKHLITLRYDNRLKMFKNLEIMELTEADSSINANLLIIFKKLKQLKFYLDLDLIDYSKERINNSLTEILNDKVKLKREVDIYIEGVKIMNLDKFKELAKDSSDYGDLSWKFILNNYDLLDLNLPFIHYLDYGHLERCIDNIKTDLPASFFDKLFNIYSVEINNDVKDIDGLNWFLNNLKCLRELKINVSLGEAFYYNLPNTIRYLSIISKENINYDFILKLHKLNEFESLVDKDLFDLVFTSFLNLKCLKKINFYFERKSIVIEKEDKVFYLNGKEILNYNQLVEECNKIRSKN